MTSVFISYSRTDKNIAEYIGAELRNRGADVFIDYQRLIGGENFIGRLGREIESRDFFVLLLSPRSVSSRWVQAEAAWALRCNKPIIPILIEPASLANFFFLIPLEQIDLTRWSVDGKVDAAVQKLATALRLPIESTNAQPLPELLTQAQSTEEPSQKVEVTTAPAYAISDLSELFTTAAEIAERDPEQAVFLYHRVIEIDPNYMRGAAKRFVRREEERLKPARVNKMLEQAQAAMKAAEWKRAEQIARDILVMDQENKEAKRIVKVSALNAKYEPVYERAVAAARSGHWRAVVTLMRDIKKTCPEYGDPKNVWTTSRIQTEFIAFLRELTSLREPAGAVYDVAFSPNGKLLASGSEDTSIKLWEMPCGHKLDTPLEHDGGVYSIAFSPDGNLLASGSADKSIKLWKMPRGNKFATLRGHSGHVNSIAFSSDGRLLASVSGNSGIKLWKIPSGEKIVTFRVQGSLVSSVAFSPDGKVLAFGSRYRINLLRIPSGRRLDALQGHKSWVYSVVFSPNGNLLASGSSDKSIKLWDMLNGRELATFRGHTKSVNSVVFSPDGKLLASGSDDKTIKLWEIPSGCELTTLQGHSNKVLSVAFSPDGKLLASGSEDNTIRLWGLG